MNMISTLTDLFFKRRMAQLVAGLTCLIAVSASAQWQWLDKDGRKVYSDRAPPSDILEKNIQKRPAGRAVPSPVIKPADGGDGTNTDAAAAAAAAAGAAQAAQNANGNVPKLPGVDKELEQKKKQAADAEAAKRKGEEEKVTKAKIENCARAKQAKVTFDSGVRIGRTNEKGEREIIDDATRAAESKRVQEIINTSCN
jgi:Domain of unknown function (DUF4124)